MSAHAKSEDLLRIGAYKAGTDADLDRALRMMPSLRSYVEQRSDERVSMNDSVERLLGDGLAMSGLRRLAKLYGMVERAHLAELQVATRDYEEAEQTRRAEVEFAKAQEGAAREALVVGDAAGWKVSEAVGAAASARAGRLLRLGEERAEVREQASVAYRESRVRAEQMQRMAERARMQAAIDEGRRVQAAADDRYSSRKGWMRGRRGGDEGSLM